MPVFHDHKTIFLHIGKTAGVAIERGLGLQPCDYREYQPDKVYGINKGVMTQHARPDYIRSIVGQDTWNDYYKFRIVRNPWDRMVSAYYYLYNINIKNHGDFASWLMSMHEQVLSRTYREGSHVTPQIEYTHHLGEQVLDYIGRYEQLLDSFQHVCNEIGIDPPELQLLNPSGNRRSKDYKSAYNSLTKNLVSEMYGEEIELYQYTF